MSELAAIKQNFRHDLLASVVVFLVALPLCMGIAIASGAPPAAGLITGIVGGLVVGFFAGSPLQVSGPAAGLSVIVWQFIQEHGIAALGMVVLIAGVIQVVAGMLRMGQWFRAVSPAVIHGMLAGIGVLILASQFHVMIDDAPRGSGLKNLFTIPQAIMKGFFTDVGSVHFKAAMVGLVTLVVLVLWRLAPKRLSVLPAPLIAVIVATLAAIFLDLEIERVDVPESLLGSLTVLGFADFKGLNVSLLTAGAAMAFVASAETLLCATAVDKLHDGPRTKYDKELAAQGIGNMVCGVLGGLPMTGVIVRSSANVEAGAKTRASAILHGAWLLVFVAVLPFVLRQIPVAGLAAVLVYTGWKLVNVAAIRQLATYGKGEIAIYFATVVTIVSFDLLTGVVLGIVLSLVKLLYTFTHLELNLTERKDGVVDLHMNGSATVVRLPRLAQKLETVPEGVDLHVHLAQLNYIDHACLELIANWEKQHVMMGGKLFMDWEGLQARFSPSTQNSGDEVAELVDQPESKRPESMRA